MVEVDLEGKGRKKKSTHDHHHGRESWNDTVEHVLGPKAESQATQPMSRI